jgi:[acyl-carrier-protein] S-malonyltransferase
MAPFVLNKTAFVFPGQGSQYVGMGLEFFQKSAWAAEIFIQADRLLNKPVSRLCFEGPDEELARTENAQPAIFLVDYIAGKLLLEKGIKPAAVAGHSLGEYAAVAISGSMDVEDALKLVGARADLMSRAAREHPGGMWAVIGLESQAVDNVLTHFSAYTVANYNCPDQVIISGDGKNITGLEEELKGSGAKKLLPLKVSGAFHSASMAEAETQMAGLLTTVHFRQAAMPVYANVTAKPTTDPEKIRENLAKQICGSVRWEESIRAMTAEGITTFIETGPGVVLSGLIKRIDPDITIFNVGEPTSLEQTFGWIGGKS